MVKRDWNMAEKRYTSAEIVDKLRESGVPLGQG
jgi:hypothetical protein